MRRMVVVCLLALLGAADAAPKKAKRRGTFAAFIDPAAPDDPPRPAPPKPEQLSIVLLIDRAPFYAGRPLDEGRIWSVARDLVDGVLDDDLVGVMACAATVDVVMKPVRGTNAARVTRAASRVKTGSGGTIDDCLEEARTYLGPAPGRKVIVFVTDGGRTDDNLKATLDAIRRDGITLVIAPTTDADERELELELIADAAGGRVIPVDSDHERSMTFIRQIRELHFASARSTSGSARPASRRLP